jgi:hypothetical protein
MISNPEELIFISMGMERKDIDVLLHLIDYLYGVAPLPPKELRRWKKVGVISENNKVLLDPIFFTDDVHSSVFVSYWLKLLLLYRNVAKLRLRRKDEDSEQISD